MLRKLEGMIGLSEVKREVADLVDLIASAKARSRLGCPLPRCPDTWCSPVLPVPVRPRWRGFTVSC